MKVTMISNYINHHQIPFSNELFQRLGEGYKFIQTEPMEEERVKMGWGVKEEEIPYLLYLEKEEEYCRQLINESEILLIGWNEREELFTERLQSNKLTFRISERIYREGQWKAISPRGLLRKYKEHTRYRKKPVYLLCAGAYVASDFSLVKAYPGKMFRFGYFPEFIEYSLEELKENHPWGEYPGEKEIQIVWAGRFIPLKYPEFAIKLAESLKKQGYSFHLHMVGGGELEKELKQEAEEKKLQKEITFYGFLKPEQVRGIMEKSHIHLFTSNHLEGWGAVVNEAMNCGCVEVVNSQVGAAAFLIHHGKNGFIYREGNFEDLEKNVIFLLEHPKEASEMAQQAYKTIATQWNAKEAVKRLLSFWEEWKQGRMISFPEGPFSTAHVIPPARMWDEICQNSMEHSRKKVK